MYTLMLNKSVTRLSPLQKNNDVWYGADHQATLLEKRADIWVLKLIHSFMKYLLHLYLEKTHAAIYTV